MKIKIKGENGAGDQVFEADTDQELIANLVTAHENATRKIRELSQTLREREQLLKELGDLLTKLNNNPRF